MCGYCIERMALDVLKSDRQGTLQMKDLGSSLHRYFFLRETPDFISGLDSLKRSLAHKRLSFFTEVPHSVVLYRGLEILLAQGFSSSDYQKLLKNPLYRDAVAALCSAEERNKFESATAGLHIEHLGLLYEAETYFWGERSKQLRTLANVLPSCRNLLKHYVEWWLDGKELQMVDEFCIYGDERSRFNLLCRALYFSIQMVGSCSAGKKMLAAIIEKESAGTPKPYGEELWLQRVAAQKLYDLVGFEPFLKHLTTTRATNYYYLDIVRGFSIEQKQMLLDEVGYHPESKTSDNFISLSRWLKMHLAGQS